MTAQAGDILIYKKEELFMAAEPLKGYLETVSLPNKLVAPTTACWRGYYSKWAIDNKKLFLIEWVGYILDNQKVGMNYIFPGEEIVFASWFTGTIRIPMGEIVCYVHGGYESVHEWDLFLEIKKGVLVKEDIKWLTEKEIEKIKKEAENDDLPF